MSGGWPWSAGGCDCGCGSSTPNPCDCNPATDGVCCGCGDGFDFPHPYPCGLQTCGTLAITDSCAYRVGGPVGGACTGTCVQYGTGATDCFGTGPYTHVISVESGSCVGGGTSCAGCSGGSGGCGSGGVYCPESTADYQISCACQEVDGVKTRGVMLTKTIGLCDGAGGITSCSQYTSFLPDGSYTTSPFSGVFTFPGCSGPECGPVTVTEKTS